MKVITTKDHYLKWVKDARPGEQMTLHVGLCGTVPLWQRGWDDERATVFQKPVGAVDVAGARPYRWFAVRVSEKTQKRLERCGDYETQGGEAA